MKSKKIILTAPCDGKIMALKSVPDKVFSSGFIGEGFAILPTSGDFFAPCTGRINVVFKTGHAFGFSIGKIDILMHIGIDTVELNGEGFTINVKKGKKASPKTSICICDLKFIKSKGKSMITPVVVTKDTLEGKKIEILVKFGATVNAGDEIAQVISE